MEGATSGEFIWTGKLLVHGNEAKMLDNIHLRELLLVSNNLTPDNVGDSMMRAVVLKAAIADPVGKARADQIIERIRAYARSADIGWTIFQQPIELKKKLTEVNIWQLIGVAGTLFDLNYCFERIEEASILTFENSAPVRFYLNGIFHYATALFLLDAKRNFEKGLPRPGTIIKALHPMGLGELLNPIYQVFDRPLGETMSYGDTILRNRNRQFVHGSFSPENIKDLVKDTDIFNENQRLRFVEYHRDLNDRVIMLRLQLTSILTRQDIDMTEFSPSKIYHL